MAQHLARDGHNLDLNAWALHIGTPSSAMPRLYWAYGAGAELVRPLGGRGLGGISAPLEVCCHMMTLNA